MNILEFVDRKNSHMTHLEDLILLGKEGIEEMNDKIDKFISSFDDDLPDGLVATSKIDGAPAVTVWSKFEGYPDNSICLKSFITSNKNCLSTYEDIEDKYGDRPDMAAKLKYCLQLAHCIPPGESWQGDCLYTKNNLKTINIDGNEYLAFHPNKIIYAFTENNQDYQKIKESSFGICFHTIYKGDLENKTQSFRVDTSRLVGVPKSIYFMSPELIISKDTKTFNLERIKSLYEKLKSAEKRLLGTPEYEELTSNPLFMKYWNMFENSYLADNQMSKLEVESIVNDLSQFINNKLKTEFEKKLSTLKTQQGQDSATSAYNSRLEEFKNIINSNKQLLLDMCSALNYAIEIKMLMLKGYSSIDPDYKTFYKSTSRGYIPAEAEGIAISSGPDIVKIVDRSVFSHANRDPDIESGFDH